MTAYVDASEFSSLDYSRQESPVFDYPTPSNSSDAGTVKEEPNKKKRKAWGQPVPDIVQILPPRKRAKTAEEKEQRKNERILRNRRAADKSRQRQKAQQSQLELQNKQLIAENAQMREVLQKAGLLSDFHFTPPASVSESVYDDTPEHEDFTPQQQPIFSANSPVPSIKHESPCLAPSIDLQQTLEPSTSVLSGMAHYPAVVLCDLQCQPVLDKKLRQLQPSPLVNTILTLIHYLTIATTSSTSMLSQMSRLYQTLEAALSTSSAQLETIVLNNFPLIHILISMPSTSTQPAIFRIKLLSRLLTCNPSLAPLLLTAADRVLQQNTVEGDWTEDADRRWTVASLVTVKWSVRWLCNEHAGIRMALRNGKLDRDSLYQKEKHGVDCAAVERHFRLFDEIDPPPSVQIVSPSTSSFLTSIEAH